MPVMVTITNGAAGVKRLFCSRYLPYHCRHTYKPSPTNNQSSPFEKIRKSCDGTLTDVGNAEGAAGVSHCYDQCLAV